MKTVLTGVGPYGLSLNSLWLWLSIRL